jgi:glycosyltransferase involved in cell wall biosynthesis
MKIAFLDRYSVAAGLHKDPITIPHALVARGHDVSLVSVDEWQGTLFGLRVEPLSRWQAELRIQRPDAVVAITRFNPTLTPTLRWIKECGIRLIVKGDTDGTIGYPLVPNYLRARPIGCNPMNLIRHLKWRLPLGVMVRRRLEHIALSDLTVVESPGAAINLFQILKYWGYVGNLGVLRFIPNPVSPSAMLKPPVKSRNKMIVSIGRWDDAVKGADLLCQTIERTLSTRRDYRFLIIGKGGEAVRSKLREEFRGFVECVGQLEFEATQEALSEARILLTTSLLESFSFVTAEALCAGASVVVTPVESLVYLAGGGAYGSIARGFSANALDAALLREIQEWEQGARDPETIAARWRSELDQSGIGREWERAVAGSPIG